MLKFYLTEITTKDKLIHQGIYFEPSKKSDVAILWVHGLTSTFYGKPVLNETIANECEKHGWGYANFHTRGHDLIAGIKQIDTSTDTGFTRLNAGGGGEKFEDCIEDINAAVQFLVGKGYKKIFLAGHSTGANKACFYVGTGHTKYISGVMLLSPISDRLCPSAQVSTFTLLVMRFLVIIGRGDIPLIDSRYYPMTPKRYLSLYIKGSNEDVFGYGDDPPRMKIYSQITKPLLVILCQKDEVADRPVDRIQKVFDQQNCSNKYQSFVIPGAFHSFEGKEDVFASSVSVWIQKVLK